MFKNPFSFTGRIRRLEYGLSMLVYAVASIIISITIELTPIVAIAFIPMIWFLWSQGAKRCHDRGATGFFQLIPWYGFWMLFADSVPGKNEYGENPKGVEAVT